MHEKLMYSLTFLAVDSCCSCVKGWTSSHFWTVTQWVSSTTIFFLPTVVTSPGQLRFSLGLLSWAMLLLTYYFLSIFCSDITTMKHVKSPFYIVHLPLYVCFTHYSCSCPCHWDFRVLLLQYAHLFFLPLQWKEKATYTNKVHSVSHIRKESMFSWLQGLWVL